MATYFVSDLHLKDKHERNSQILLRFLHFLLNQDSAELSTTKLYLLGDIFDFWLSGHMTFVRKFQSLIDAIAELKNKGVEVVYFEGNHDFHIDEFWTKKLNIPVYEDAQYMQIEGLTVRIEHGDLINLDDHAYLKYRATIRHPWVEPIGHILPGWFWNWFGHKMSRKSRKKTSLYGKQNRAELIEMIHHHAHRSFDEKPYDLLVAGHMHVFDSYEFVVQSKKAISINLGTWLEHPRILKLHQKELHYLKLEVDF